MRRDIRWNTRREDKTSYEVRVSYFGGRYKFQFRESTENHWDYDRKPSLEDYDELHQGVLRRYQRRQASQIEVDEAARLLKEATRTAS